MSTLSFSSTLGSQKQRMCPNILYLKIYLYLLYVCYPYNQPPHTQYVCLCTYAHTPTVGTRLCLNPSSAVMVAQVCDLCMPQLSYFSSFKEDDNSTYLRVIVRNLSVYLLAQNKH